MYNGKRYEKQINYHIYLFISRYLFNNKNKKPEPEGHLHRSTRTHQEMRDSEREPFYDDIARTYFKILKKVIPPAGFEPETVKHLAA